MRHLLQFCLFALLLAQQAAAQSVFENLFVDSRQGDNATAANGTVATAANDTEDILTPLEDVGDGKLSGRVNMTYSTHYW